MSSRKLEDLVEVVEPSALPADAQCSICMDALWDAKYTEDFRTQPEGTAHMPTRPRVCADHVFHLGCLRTWLKDKPSCPLCRQQLVVLTGYQPQTEGSEMTVLRDPRPLPDHAGSGTLVVQFFVAAGVQDLDCPLPGEPFGALRFTTYLPDNPEGEEVVRLLRLAWNRRLLFRMGMNPATGRVDRLVLNGFELKTQRTGGFAGNGYPDPSYLSRLKSDLREVGVS